ncbi:VID24 Vacuolar import and degradation protein [Pyrenophora tritici-repentis]|nr:VID24 Vacuolar import and degradation protein [Pyrenophora tritici-repentis]KAI2482013.1 VID24 Vacuolar import and degradation protein [Pyrenophora tritici-repentis]
MLAARNSLNNELPERDRETARHMSMQRLSDARSSPMLEQTVKYLSRIRHSNTIDESLECARDAGFLTKDYFCLQHSDFIADTFTIPTPTESSWLAPGAVLSGCQHATSIAATASRHNGLVPPIRPWIWNPNEASTTRSSQLPDAPPQQDRWPVKVTIHDVDWDKMALSATMEAYNVPSHPHSHSILNTNSTSPPVTRTSSITTYLEGEILDFNNHTLLTESFKSNAANDATYWRKLPPFQKMSDDEVVRSLTSKKWLTEVLGQEWILMRWKERCFVKSLNRSTADPVQPPPSTTIPSFPDGPARNTWASSNNSSTYYPPTSNSNHASQLQPSPYRIVRNANTGRAEVEITPQPLFNSSATNDAEHATFDDSGCGLTISGFYYVALDRRNGMLEGLYYDPQSSPYQCLKLESVRGGLRSAWGFR